jgi:YD repeat-containing protein
VAGSAASVTIVPAGSDTPSRSVNACGQSWRYSGIHSSTSTTPFGRRAVSSIADVPAAADGTMAQTFIAAGNRTGETVPTGISVTIAALDTARVDSWSAKYTSRLGVSARR